jgi:hypothetical protein
MYWGIAGRKYRANSLEGIRLYNIRTDNSVKNKFFSKYRRAIKNINQTLNHSQKFKVKDLKIGLVYKLINFLERKDRFSCEVDKEIMENARCIECGYLVIKNEIITFE